MGATIEERKGADGYQWLRRDDQRPAVNFGSDELWWRKPYTYTEIANISYHVFADRVGVLDPARTSRAHIYAEGGAHIDEGQWESRKPGLLVPLVPL